DVGGVPRTDLAHVGVDHAVSDWDPGAGGGLREIICMLLDGESVYFAARGSDGNSDLFTADRSTAVVRFLKHTWNGSIFALAKSGGRLYLAGDVIYFVD